MVKLRLGAYDWLTMLKLRLGAYDPTLPPKRTPLGITLYAYGLDDYGPKRVRKTCQRMIEAGVSDWLIEQFRGWALRLPAELPMWADTAYTVQVDKWLACVGRRLPDGTTVKQSVLSTITPASITIKLHETAFNTPQGVLTAGAAWTDRIEVVAALVDHDNTWLRRCDELFAWELGNLIGLRCGYRPRTVEAEIGNQSPCAL